MFSTLFPAQGQCTACGCAQQTRGPENCLQLMASMLGLRSLGDFSWGVREQGANVGLYVQGE